jgi:transcriptional regulator GlxA family with amidase domain
VHCQGREDRDDISADKVGGGVIVPAGISARIDQALHVVARLHGRELARETARCMEYDWRPER